MAINPEKLVSAFDKEVDKYEELLDEELKDKKLVRGEVISVVTPSGLERRIVPLLEERYIKVGWTSVKYRSGDSNDNRPVNYIDFKY